MKDKRAARHISTLSGVNRPNVTKPKRPIRTIKDDMTSPIDHCSNPDSIISIVVIQLNRETHI